MVARTPHQGQTPGGGNANHTPHCEGMVHHRSGWRDVGGTATTHSSTAGPRFFNPAQLHVVESAWYASAAMIIPLQSVKSPSYGMGQQTHPEKASRGCWSQQMASCSASTGRSPGAATQSATQISTGAQGVGEPTTGLKDALKRRRRDPLTPYDKRAWAEQLSSLGLEGRYPSLIQGLSGGFDVGVPQIQKTYAPPNHPSIKSLTDVYSSIINSEFMAGRYIGPFT